MDEYNFMMVHVLVHGVTENEKYFIGRTPEIGEAVEMVCNGYTDEGAIKFQLRVKNA